MLKGIGYLAALLPLTLAYGLRERPLLTGVLIGVVALIAATALLRTAARATPWNRLVAHAAVIGLAVGEIGWALSYWTVAQLVGGAALWLALYVFTGMSEHALDGSLGRQVVLEYAAVAAAGVMIVLLSAPWRG